MFACKYKCLLMFISQCNKVRPFVYQIFSSHDYWQVILKLPNYLMFIGWWKQTKYLKVIIEVTWAKTTEGLWTRLIPRIALNRFLPFPTVVNSYNDVQITVCKRNVFYLSVIWFHCTNTCFDDDVSLCFYYCIITWPSLIISSRPLWI